MESIDLWIPWNPWIPTIPQICTSMEPTPWIFHGTLGFHGLMESMDPRICDPWILGLARTGTAQIGMARAWAWQGLARHGFGTAWSLKAWHVESWARRDSARHSTARHGASPLSGSQQLKATSTLIAPRTHVNEHHRLP